jgi:hypothetical protein
MGYANARGTNGSVAMAGLTGELSDVWQGKELEDEAYPGPNPGPPTFLKRYDSKFEVVVGKRSDSMGVTVFLRCTEDLSGRRARVRSREDRASGNDGEWQTRVRVALNSNMC